jgi:DNA invertase Pin-like site-specific DNA recombinase
MKIGYGRVSSRDQHLDIQYARLEAAGCQEIYLEKQTGTSRAHRPQLERALTRVRTADVFVVTKLDRLARNILDLHQIAQRIKQEGATLEILDQPMDMDTMTGEVLFAVFALMAQLETNLRRERQREGILAAQAKGKHFGRTKMLTPAQVTEMHQLRASGMPVAELKKHYGLTRTSIYRYLASQGGAA